MRSDAPVFFKSAMLPSSYITAAEKIKSVVRFLNHLNDFKFTLYDFFFYDLFNDLENRFNDLEIRSNNLKKSFQRFKIGCTY